MQEKKIDCRVAKKFDALAHLVEQEYDPHFRPWYGGLDVDCTFEAMYEMLGENVFLQFADGRVGTARLLGRGAEEVRVPLAGRAAGRHCTAYFVGVTRLDLPVPSRPQPNS
jgi:hypothetical protein